PKLDGVVFTGSTETGMELFRIMSSGGRIRPCLMEMGGKNGAVIFPSSDLDEAVEACARSAFGLSGQACSALSRVIVHASIHDAFVEKLAARAKSVTVGDPSNVDIYMGPVIDQRAVERFEQAAGEARRDGVIHAGGEKLSGGDFDRGYFVSPTVVSLPKGHALHRRELFLPFLTVQDRKSTRLNSSHVKISYA